MHLSARSEKWMFAIYVYFKISVLAKMLILYVQTNVCINVFFLTENCIEYIPCTIKQKIFFEFNDYWLGTSYSHLPFYAITDTLGMH